MKSNSNITRILVAGWLALSSLSYAQENDLLTYNFEILTLASDTRVERNREAVHPNDTIFAYASKEGLIEVRPTLLRQAGPFEYTGPNPMKLFQKKKNQYQHIGSILLDTSLVKPLLIIDCVQSEPNTVRTQLIDIAPSNIKRGEAMFINTTAYPTLCLLDQSKIGIAANSSVKTKIGISDRNMSAVKMAFYDQSKDDWKLLYSTAHHLNETMRLLVFLVNSGQERAPIQINLIQLKNDPEKAPMQSDTTN